MSAHSCPVAVVGIACRLPDADTPARFHEILKAGHTAIRDPGEQRVRRTGYPADVAYLPMGYLDRIDLFDHDFFGISLREAEIMDPHQRVLLQLAHAAFEDAGLAPATLRGSGTGVYLGTHQTTYRTLYAEPDPQQVLGTLPSASAARLSYVLDLQGPALVVDTACSSGLAAVAMAVQQLRSGAVDTAIAGGVSVHPVLTRRTGYEPLRGIDSPDGTCRPFDARANGTVGGEGGGIVVLKRLADAVADLDTVHAVITGIALNHNGHRAVSMAAPSPQAQAAAIDRACRDAGTHPAALGYIECHGSATPLGDAVEIEGLRRALSGPDRGPDHPPCAIGSVKGNIGHLDAAAGLAGLLRAVLGVREAVQYPTARFTSPNPELDLGNLLTVPERATSWPAENGAPRRAGISSFGLTGTNVHVVIEQAPAAPPDNGHATTGEHHLLTLSAKTGTALRRYCRDWARFLEGTTHSLAAIAQTMNRGRDDHRYRLAFVVRSTAELADALSAAAPPERPIPLARPVVALFSGGDAASPSAPDDEAARQHALYGLLAALGLPTGRFVGCGTGNRAIQLVRGGPAEGSRAAEVPGRGIDHARLRAAVTTFVRDGAVLVELGPGAQLSEAIRPLADLPIVSFAGGEGQEFLLSRLALLYTLGADIDWTRHHAGTDLPRIPAPTYPFEEVPCWYHPPGAAAEARGAEVPDRATGDDRGVEHRIAAVWKQVLKVPQVDPESDYFALGGTSIAGMTVLREIEQEFGVELGFTDLYDHPTLEKLAERIRRHLPARRPSLLLAPITPVRRDGDLPLSFGQEQLWYLDRLIPDSPLYNIPVDLRLTGVLDATALAGALEDLAERHEVLRSRLPDHDGEPFTSASAPPPHLPITDLSALPQQEQTRLVGELAAQDASLPFDLTSGPLWRSTLLTLAPDDHVLLLTWHHIVFDGWSPSIFFPELSELYQARRDGRPHTLAALPVQYADYAAWQRERWSSTAAPGLGYWRQRLSGLRRPELPLDHPRPPMREFAGGTVEFTVDTGLADLVRDFSRRHGVTSFVTMLAALTALLHRWAGWQDVVIGVATSGRNHPDTQGLIGYFNNALPFRTEVTGELSFTDLTARCARTAAGVLDHDIPFEKIVSALGGRRDPARHPVFDVAYTHQNAPSQVAELPGLRSDRQSAGPLSGVAPGTAKFDLTLGVVEQGQGAMHGYVEYAVALFDRSTATRLADRFTTLLRQVLSDPHRRLDPPRRPRVAAGTRTTGEPAPFWRSVARHAAVRPDQPAVVDDRGHHTYRQLNRMANRLARRLVAAGVTAESLVPVLAHRDVDLVVGWLAVAKAGGAFVPVDPDSPQPRVDAILSDIGAPVVVLGRRVTSVPPATGHLLVDPATTDADDHDLTPAFVSRGLAYVCYTSGSSGRPHGCATEHGQLDEVVRWYRDTLELTAADRVLQGAWPSFDTAIMEVFATLDPGATLQLADAAVRDPAALLNWMSDHDTTAAFLPTPLAEVLLTEVEPPAGLRLRVLTTGGDQLRTRPEPPPPFRLLNMYGPTECTIVATAGDVVPRSATVASSAAHQDAGLPDIGTPITGTAVHLLDAGGREVADGELGEIHIGGVVVGRGYHKMPGLTASRFLADPFTGPPGARMYRTGDVGRRLPGGALEFRGRADDQVEIRGHRVEPAEVEQVLRKHPSIAQALVVGIPVATGGHRLVAHVVPAGPAPGAGEVITWAAAALPAYLVPDHVVITDDLPTTANGKLDRKRARQATGTLPARAGGTTPGRSTAERVITGLCAELLGRDHVSALDNFFDLGGDSLLGIRLGARAAKAGIRFTPQDLLRHRTLRDLVGSSAPPITGTGASAPTSVPLSPIMHAFLDAMPGRSSGFVQAHVLQASGNPDPEMVRTALHAVVERHEVLRYRLRHNAIGRYFACAPREENDLLDVTTLTASTVEQQRTVLEHDHTELASVIDLETGPLLRARFYDRGPDQSPLVLLLVHHFVFDSVSAVVLLDDLDAVLTRPTDNPAGPTTSPGWSLWAQHLNEMASSDTVAAELPYWADALRACAATPAPPPGQPGGGGSVHRTAAIGETPPALAEGGETAAICALACGLARWQATPAVAVMVEGTAAPNPYRPLGRAATVGWYTSLHPVVLPADPSRSTTDCLPAVTGSLGAVPHDGVGYGILRHLSPAAPAIAELRSQPEPSIMLGHQRHDGTHLDAGATAFTLRTDLYPDAQHSVTARFSLVLVSAVKDGSLDLLIMFDGRFTRAEVEALADHVVGAFTELVEDPTCRP